MTLTRWTQVFLVANSLFWLPWGFINLVFPESWSGELITGMDVFDLSSPVARTEVRAMYGGLQMAIGIFALTGAFRERHRRSALLFMTMALTLLAGCRFGGMVVEGDDTYLSFGARVPPGQYNQVGLAMYELPNAILAWVLAVAWWRRRPADELDDLRRENAELRERLDARATPVGSGR